MIMRMRATTIKRTGIAIAVAVLAFAAWWLESYDNKPTHSESVDSAIHARDDLTPGAIERAFERRQSNIVVTQQGRIAKLLSDDREGSRHQRFIVQLPSGITVLVAHNIDLAPRVSGLKVGQAIIFRGEYEWNKKGGVIHWTHHDPRGSHPGGWLEYEGKRYQ